MKYTGLLRRIDDLGRIVIPKEIRKKLHIKNGDLLEIFLNDINTISLRKYAVINEDLYFFNDFINIVAKELKCNLFITNMDTIVFSNIEDLKNEKIDFLNSNNTDFISLTKNYVINYPFIVKEINPNGDLLGYLIYEIKDDKYIDNSVADFSYRFINECLENK